MGFSFLNSSFLGVILLVASALPSPGGPRATACPACPPDAVYLECSQAKARAEWVLQPGVATGFRFPAWRSRLTLTVKRETSSTLHVDLVWLGTDGSKRTRRKVLIKGQSILLQPGVDLEPGRYGEALDEVRCTWVE